MELGEKLRTKRLELGYTVQETADLLKISKGYVTQVELGSKYPSDKIKVRMMHFIKDEDLPNRMYEKFYEMGYTQAMQDIEFKVKNIFKE